MEGVIMGQLLHGCAKTTEAVRRAIQNSQESLNKLSKRYAINPKMLLNGRKEALFKMFPWGLNKHVLAF